jgi:hypothetical protein
MVSRLIQLFILTVTGLLLVGCADIPDSYAPPIQRKPVNGPGSLPLGSFITMGDPNADAHIVRDISRPEEATSWRWTHQKPALRFFLDTTENQKFVMDFTISDVTFKQTGPVTITFLINDKLLDTIRYDRPGSKHFEKQVPAEWLQTGTPVTVAAEVDKSYIAPEDGAKLGFILTSAGFIR